MEASKVGALLGPWHSRIWRHQLSIVRLSTDMVFLRVCEYMKKDRVKVTVESHDYGFESREDQGVAKASPQAAAHSPRGHCWLERTVPLPLVTCEFIIAGRGKIMGLENTHSTN